MKFLPVFIYYQNLEGDYRYILYKHIKMICFIADVTLSGTPKKDPSHASHSLPNNQIPKKSFVNRPEKPQGMPSTRAKPQRLHQALSCALITKLFCIQLKKESVLVNQSYQSVSPFLHGFLLCVLPCFLPIFCSVF